MRALILALLLMHAAEAHGRMPPLPVPPLPPAEPPAMAAPVPNRDMSRRFDDERRSVVTLDAEINHRATPGVGLGFAPGARYQLDNDHRTFALPGIMLHVPLP